jgi:hypothetical protein
MFILNNMIFHTACHVNGINVHKRAHANSTRIEPAELHCTVRTVGQTGQTITTSSSKYNYTRRLDVTPRALNYRPDHNNKLFKTRLHTASPCQGSVLGPLLYLIYTRIYHSNLCRRYCNIIHGQPLLHTNFKSIYLQSKAGLKNGE